MGYEQRVLANANRLKYFQPGSMILLRLARHSMQSPLYKDWLH